MSDDTRSIKDKMIDIIKYNKEYKENDGIIYIQDKTVNEIKTKLYEILGDKINPDLNMIFSEYKNGVYIYLRWYKW